MLEIMISQKNELIENDKQLKAYENEFLNKAKNELFPNGYDTNSMSSESSRKVLSDQKQK